MKTVKNIVVPVDFAENTGKLVTYACYMAERLAASVHFVHVVAPYQGDAMIGAPFVGDFHDKMFSAMEERMANLVSDTRGQFPDCSGQTISGEPVDRIVEIAEARDADLIIISTHGAKGLEKILLGSVAERVLKRAHCPVLIMNPFKKQK